MILRFLDRLLENRQRRVLDKFEFELAVHGIKVARELDIESQKVRDKADKSKPSFDHAYNRYSKKKGELDEYNNLVQLYYSVKQEVYAGG